MPPKKQQQDLQSTPYVPITVLPILVGSKVVLQALKKPVNIKKTIDIDKISEILKDKGLQSHKKADTGVISQEGRKIICENMPFVLEEIINQTRKPPQAKKDVKKDAKKDAKKEEIPVQEGQKTLEFDFQRECSDFYFLLDCPKNEKELVSVLRAGLTIDIIVVVKERIMKGSKEPNYALLGQKLNVQDFERGINELQPHADEGAEQQSRNFLLQESRRARKMVKKFLAYRQQQPSGSPFQNSLVIEVGYQKNLRNPETDSQNFLRNLFTKICAATVQRSLYLAWRETTSVKPMIEPKRQIIKKEVQVQAKDEKKGAKKDSKAEPKVEIIQEVVETKYQSLIENRKSDLKVYKKIDQLRKDNLKQDNPYRNALQNLILAIDEKTNAKDFMPEEQVKNLATELRRKQLNTPIHQVTRHNLFDYLPQIKTPYSHSMCYELQTIFPKIQQQFSLSQMKFFCPDTLKFTKCIKTEYLIQQFESLVNKTDSRFKWSFKDRKFIERMTEDKFYGVINEQMLKDPKIYKGQLEIDKIRLIILAEINPPGRVLYNTLKFSNKTVPNFEVWRKNSKEFSKSNTSQQENKRKPQFFDYRFHKAGNLKILTKNMMPTDNTIIRDEVLTIGDQQESIIAVMMGNNTTKVGVKHLNSESSLKADENLNCFWLKNQDLSLNLRPYYRNVVKHTIIQKQIIDQQGKKVVRAETIKEQIKLFSISLWITRQRYTVQMQSYPTIFFHKPAKNQEIRRKIDCNGVVTRDFSDGSIIIFYPNGNISKNKHGKWQKIINNVIMDSQSGQERPLKLRRSIEGQKIVTIRQDQTIFVQTSGQTQVLFSDGTQVISSSKPKQILIKNPEQITIRITFPPESMITQNVIGYGSAFAYLGFKNILQRSCNGYLFQYFDPCFTTHLYLQKYQLNSIIYQQETMLVGLEDSIMRVKNSGEAVLIGKKEMVNRGRGSSRVQGDEQLLSQRWLQLFTTKDNHREGLYAIDLKEGSISTKDGQSNIFKVKVGQPSQVKIAVSFKIDDQNNDENADEFENGFHIPELNYFLPPPSNNRPARLFSFDQESNQFCEYLSQAQIPQLNGYYSKIQPQSANSPKTIELTYSPEPSSVRGYMQHSFTQNLDFTSAFQIPDLIKPHSTILNLTKASYSHVFHRVIEQIQWDQQYKNSHQIAEKVGKSKAERARQKEKLNLQKK